MKRLLISGMVALLVALMVTMAAQAAPPEPLYFEKVCDLVARECTIQNSDLAEVELNLGSLAYLGPVFDLDRLFISSEVELVALDGSTAMGHFVWLTDHGYFTFRRGTGNLAGFHARGEIAYIGDTTWSLTGTYHFKP